MRKIGTVLLGAALSLSFAALFCGAGFAAEDDPEIDGKPLSELLKQLRGVNRGFQLRAAKALAAAPETARAQVIAAVQPVLKSERENDRFVAAQILGEFGPAARAAVPDLLPILEGTQFERNRAAAAKALGLILKDAKPSEEAEKVVRALVRKIDDDWDKYEDVRREAAHAIGMIGPAAKSAIPRLTRVLQNSGPHGEFRGVRRAAAWTCGRMGPLAAEHADRLISMMMSEGEWAPEYVEALGFIGPVNDNIASNIMDKIETTNTTTERLAITDPADRFRVKAFAALARFGPKAAIAVPLMRRMAGGSPEKFSFIMRTEIMNTFAAIGPNAKAALPEIEANLRYSNYSDWSLSHEDKVQLHKMLHDAAAKAYKAVTGNEPPKTEEKK